MADSVNAIDSLCDALMEARAVLHDLSADLAIGVGRNLGKSWSEYQVSDDTVRELHVWLDKYARGGE